MHFVLINIFISHAQQSTNHLGYQFLPIMRPLSPLHTLQNLRKTCTTVRTLTWERDFIPLYKKIGKETNVYQIRIF